MRSLNVNSLFTASFLAVSLCAALCICAPHAQAASGTMQNPTITKAQLSAIAPHKAEYDMKLGSVKNGSNVTDVTGKLVFEWADACDGWTVQQHMQMHFSYSGGSDLDVNSSELSWESKDGKKYNFNVHHFNNGQESDAFEGKAMLNGGKSNVRYVEPGKKNISLPEGTLFPTAHTEMILQKAAAGEKFFMRRVFDGTDEVGANDISVFIGSPVEFVSSDDALKKNPLLQGKAWPVHLAFFKPDGQNDSPDYEMNLSLMANGVASAMRIDYGDFSVVGTLTNISPLPSGCP